jgi:hypothetical protein
MHGSRKDISAKHFFDAVMKITEYDMPGENVVDPVEASFFHTAHEEIVNAKKTYDDEVEALTREYNRRMQ